MSHKQLFRLLAAMLVVVNLFACTSPVPSPTPAPTTPPTPRPSPTPSPTPSPAEPAEEAFRLLRQSDFEGALAAYQRAIEIDESYGPAYAGIAYVYLVQEEKDAQALEQAQKGVELAPDSAFAQAVLARAQIENYLYSEALASAQKAVELEPESVFAQATLALAHLTSNQFDEARLAAEEAYRLDPQSADALVALGWYYQATADFARALAAHQRAAELEPEYASWQTALAALWHDAGQYEQAASAYQKALELAPDHLPALLGLAQLDMDRYDYAAAGKKLDELEELAPQSVGAKILRGYLNLYQGENKAALAQFKQAMELNPREYSAHHGLAIAYLWQGECDQMKSQIQKTASDFPPLATIDADLGFAELCAGDANKALNRFREAIKTDPYSARAQIGMGDAYATQGRREDAAKAYLQALRLSPSVGDIHKMLGNNLDSQGLRDEARQEMTTALRLDPYLPEAYLSLGFFNYLEDKFPEAQQMVEKALQLDPNHFGARRFLGVLQMVQNNPAQAVQTLQQALDDDPDDVLSHLFLTLAHRDQGNYRQALKELETYQALAGNALSETDAFFTGYLAYALETGYLLTEQKALSDIRDFYLEVAQKNLDVKVEELEEGRTLVATLPVSQAEIESEAFLQPLGIVTTLASFIGPRIDPPVDNGLLIRFTQGGKPAFTVSAPLKMLKQQSDTLITPEQFTEQLEIDLVEGNNQSASVADISRQMAELRELELQAAIPVDTLTAEEMAASLQDSVDEQVRQSMQQDAELLTLLGAISPTLDLEQTWTDLYNEQVAGYYDSEEEAIYLEERDGTTDIDALTLAHEVAHALQDQHFDLDALDETEMNDDQRLAVDALIEGDSSLASVMYLQEHVPLLDRLDAATEASGLETEELESAPPFISELTLFPYFSGMEFVSALHERDGWEGVNQAYTELPQSSEQILHPDRYFAGEAPVAVSLPQIDPQTGWQEADRDVLGELGLRLALMQHLGPVAAEAAAEGWGGDEYLLLESQAGDQFALLLRTVWDSSEEAEEFWRLYRAYLNHRPGFSEVVEELVGEPEWRQWAGPANSAFIRLDGETVDIVIAPDAAAAQALVEELD